MAAGLQGRLGTGWWIGIFAVCLGLFGISATTVSAVEVQTHAFDATLSLRGDCSTPEADPVPDPSCPYPAPPPLTRFNLPRGVAVDQYGNIYVASLPASEVDGVIDIFDSSGHFLSEIADNKGPRSLAVDSEGHLYVYRYEIGTIGEEIVRYDPKVYEPITGKIEYENTPAKTVFKGFTSINVTIAVDTSSDLGHKDHLFVPFADHINEYGSATEGNPLLDEKIGAGVLERAKNVAIDPNTHDIYVGTGVELGPNERSVVEVFDGEAVNHPLLRTIEGDPGTGPACPPAGKFASDQGYLSVAIDGSNGHVFVYDAQKSPKAVYEFDETGTECISRIEKGFGYLLGDQIAIDNGTKSPNGEENTIGRYLYVASGTNSSESHLWAFEPKDLSEPPKVEAIAAAEVTSTDAELKATINPGGATTHYTFEYTTQQSFEAEGFEGATAAGEGDIPAGKVGVPVSVSAAGLAPGTTYRFRVQATSECESVPLPECTDEAQATFTTFPPEEERQPCANDALRAALGLSAALPDCRAYELVSPPDTGGRAPFDVGNSPEGDSFGSPPASPDGGSLAFITRAGPLGEAGGTGARAGDSYRAGRDPQAGWGSQSIGPDGTQAAAAAPGGLSADHGYAETRVSVAGSLLLEGKTSSYVRHPDGGFHPLGEGSLATDPGARPKYIAPFGAHILFDSTVPLEADSPAAGTRAIYDRTPDGITHVVSLLPGGEIPAAGKDSAYEGSSADGSAIAFEVGSGSPLYLRLDNSETVQLAEPGATFAGLSADGRYAFYLEGGDLFRYDTEAEGTDGISSSGDVTVVNVAREGSTVFFVSSSVLTGEPNPNGATAQPGEENLYRWSWGSTEFIATVTERDVEGESTGGGGFQTGGLGLWASAMARAELANDPSRATPSGAVLLFESRADLTEYESKGKAQVYRYDSTAPSLTCLSCSPTLVAAVSDASLQTVAPNANDPIPTSRYAQIPNLSPDGARAFFQSTDALVPVDNDEVQDVYEWEAQGKGSCHAVGGCLNLISSGQSAGDNYLFGVSESGDDVFIWTTDRLLERDADETPSVYDARVEGGFPEPEPEGCEGEGCRPTLTPPPALPSPASPSSPQSNPPPGRRCPKGKHRAKRHGKVVCVRNRHKKHGRHHKTGRAGR